MRKIYLAISLLAISAVAVFSFGCGQASEDDVAGRPALSDEQKANIEENVEKAKQLAEAVQAGEVTVNDLSGKWFDTEDVSGTYKLALFAAGATEAKVDTIYGLWEGQGYVGIFEGKVTKEIKSDKAESVLAAQWYRSDGSNGLTALVFYRDEAGKLLMNGTWGNEESLTDGGYWKGQETENSEIKEEKIAELRTAYETAKAGYEANEETTEPEVKEESVVNEEETGTEEVAPTEESTEEPTV